MSYVVVLGAADPEMGLIEELARSVGVHVVHALGPDGQRVHAGQAYTVAEVSDPAAVAAADIVWAVECDGPAIPPEAVRVDHHRPGDPGWGRPPAEFLAGSSVGQVIARLARLGRLPGWPAGNGVYYSGPGCIRRQPAGWTIDDDSDPRVIPDEIVLAAAADHCLAAAYRGECPYVEPERLMAWRAATRAAHQRRPVDDILRDVQAAREALRDAPKIAIGGEPVADLRGQEIPELPEAAARDGIAFLATPRPRPGERKKVVLQCAGPAALAAWPAWARALGLTDLYGGDPARGFAGGYIA